MPIRTAGLLLETRECYRNAINAVAILGVYCHVLALHTLVIIIARYWFYFYRLLRVLGHTVRIDEVANAPFQNSNVNKREKKFAGCA